MGANKFIDDPSIKFNDDPTLKFSDDPTIKFNDDGGGPTIKFTDDPTLKFSDDPTLKFSDDGGGWPTIKFIDDPSLKFSDDVTIKFNDDGGGPTIKFIDDGNQSIKAIDDVKMPNHDKMFNDQKYAGLDQQFDPRDIYTNPATHFSAQPFILANPHHSMAWQQTFGAAAAAQPQNDPPSRAAQYEAHLQQVQETKSHLEKQLKELDEYGRKITEQYNKEKEENKNSDKKK